MVKQHTQAHPTDGALVIRNIGSGRGCDSRYRCSGRGNDSDVAAAAAASAITAGRCRARCRCRRRGYGRGSGSSGGWCGGQCGARALKVPDCVLCPLSPPPYNL
jgi:hypothetical protein